MATLLHYQDVIAHSASPSRWMLVLHGLFGAGRNWAGIARRIVEARPEWGAKLIDLREHGQSTGFSAPHSLAAAADDLHRMACHYSLSAPVVIGHSFGGKVALRFALDSKEVSTVFVVDSIPGRVENTGQAGRMLELLRELPNVFPTRQAAIESLKSRSIAEPVAQWMAMNLTPADGGFRWRMDVEAIRQLHDDFRSQDLTGELAVKQGVSFHFLRATRSELFTPSLAQSLPRLSPHIQVHNIEGGHWLNTDNPSAVADLITRRLPA